jgi:hypothetical protein
MFVIPKAGLKVADPQRGDFLPEKGRDVTENQYWHRRIKDGDVTIKQPRGKK